MGFNDQEIVALAGAHALGRCHPDRQVSKRTCPRVLNDGLPFQVWFPGTMDFLSYHSDKRLLQTAIRREVGLEEVEWPQTIRRQEDTLFDDAPVCYSVILF